MQTTWNNRSFEISCKCNLKEGNRNLPHTAENVHSAFYYAGTAGYEPGTDYFFFIAVYLVVMATLTEGVSIATQGQENVGNLTLDKHLR